jgi:hypothetical protein
MMKKRSLIAVLCLAAVTMLSAQSFTGLAKEAKELKDGGNYIEAAKKYQECRAGDLNGKALLDVLFPEAECYYMLDDYQQLDSMIVRYVACFRASREELGDSLDVYKAYLFKMLGNLMYANVDESNTGRQCANAAYNYYSNSLTIFDERNSDDNAYVLLHELAQLYYKAKVYAPAYKFLNAVKMRYQDRSDNGIVDDEPQYDKTFALMA